MSNLDWAISITTIVMGLAAGSLFAHAGGVTLRLPAVLGVLCLACATWLILAAQ